LTSYKLYYSASPSVHSIYDAGSDETTIKLLFDHFKAGINPSDWSYYPDGKAHYYSLSMVKVVDGKEQGHWFWQNPDYVAAAVAPPPPQTIYTVYHETYSDGYAFATSFSTGTADQVRLQAKTFYDTLYTLKEGTESGGGWHLSGSSITDEQKSGVYDVSSKYDRISMWDESAGPNAALLIEGWDRKYNAAGASDKTLNPFIGPPSTTPPVKKTTDKTKKTTDKTKTEDKKSTDILGGASAAASTVQDAINTAIQKTSEQFIQRVTDPAYPGGAVTAAAASEMASAFQDAFGPIANQLAADITSSINDALKQAMSGLSAAADALNPLKWLNEWWASVQQGLMTMLVGGIIIICVAGTVYWFWKQHSPAAQMNDLLRLQMQQQLIKGMEWSRTPEGAQAIGTGVGTAAKAALL